MKTEAMLNPSLAKIAPTTQEIRDAYKTHMAHPRLNQNPSRGALCRALGGFLIAEAWGVKFDLPSDVSSRVVVNASHDILIPHLRMSLSMVCQAHIDQGKLINFFIYIDPKDQSDFWRALEDSAPTTPEDYAAHRTLFNLRAQHMYPWCGLFECASEEVAEAAAGLRLSCPMPFLGALISMYPATRGARLLAFNIYHDENPEEETRP